MITNPAAAILKRGQLPYKRANATWPAVPRAISPSKPGAPDAGELAYLAPTRVNLQLTMERWPEIVFHTTREQA